MKLSMPLLVMLLALWKTQGRQQSADDDDDDCHLDDLPTPDDFFVSLLVHFGIEPGQTFGLSDMEHLLEDLGIGCDHEHEHVIAPSTDTADSSVHGGKRALSQPALVQPRPRMDPRNYNTSSNFNVTEKCFSAEDLLEVFSVADSSGLTRAEFEFLCPAIIQQQINKVCEHSAGTGEPVVTDAEKWGFGTLAVLIISLCSILGMAFAPCVSSPRFQHLMSFMIALAVGTLVTDSILHLIPQAFGLHDHGHEDHGHDDEGVVVEDYTLKGLALVAAIYAFFLLESLLDMGTGGHGHSHGNQVEIVQGDIGYLNEGFTEQNGKDQKQNGRDAEKHAPNDSEKKPGSPVNEASNVTNTGSGCFGVKSLAWMIIIGDAIHNLADGLAIGAAFSYSVGGGVSTSLAVLCHELPHELGDFAVLLRTGMSYKRAAVFNAISASLAFLGLFIGIPVSNNQTAITWIFVIAAGIFMYIALANMIPEMIHMQRTCKPRGLIFGLQNLGFLVGVGILFTIAVFEDKIKVS